MADPKAVVPPPPPGFEIAQAAAPPPGFMLQTPYQTLGVEPPAPSTGRPSSAEETLSALPAAGGIAASLIPGSPPVVSAFIGGVVGKEIEQAGRKILGLKTGGPLDVAKAGAYQGMWDVIGLGAAKGVRKLFAPMAKRFGEALAPGVQGPPTAVQNMAEIGRKFNLDLPPSAIMQSPGVRAIEFAASLSSPGRAVMNTKRLAAFQAAGDAINGTLADLSIEISPGALGTPVKNVIEATKANIRRQEQSLYAAVDQATAGAPLISLKNIQPLAESVQKQLAEMQAKLPGTMETSPRFQRFLEDYLPFVKAKGKWASSTAFGGRGLTMAKPAPNLTFNEAQQLKSALYDLGQDADPHVAAFAKRANAILFDEMKSTAQKLGPGVYETWRAADDFSKGGKTLVESAIFNKFANANPEHLGASLAPGATTDLKTIKTALLDIGKDPAAFDSFRRSWLHTQLKGPDGQFTPEVLMKLPAEIKSWGREFTGEMFGDVRGQIVMRNLRQLSTAIESLGKVGTVAGLERLGEAHAIVRVAGAAALAAFGDVAHLGPAVRAGAALYTIPYLIAKMVHSTAGTRYLTEGFNLVPKNAGKAMANIERAFEITLKGIKAVEAAKESGQPNP